MWSLLQIKQHAVELVQGLTGSPEGIAQLARHGAKLLPPLFRLVPGPEAVSRPALAALVNLSQAGTGFTRMCITLSGFLPGLL